MSNCRCSQRSDCAIISVIIAIFVGIITSFLQFSATITLTSAFLWVTFGIGVVYLPIILLLSTIQKSGEVKNCICQIITVTLIGIIGLILLSLVLLGITFAQTSIIGAIFAGLLLAFFTLTIISISCLVRCLVNCTQNISCIM